MDGKYIQQIHKKYGDHLTKFDNFYISDIIKYKIIKTIFKLYKLFI